VKKRRQIYIIESEPEPQGFEPDQAFIENFQTAVLLSLLEDKRLTRRQFDLCIEELKKQRKNISALK